MKETNALMALVLERGKTAVESEKAKEIEEEIEDEAVGAMSGGWFTLETRTMAKKRERKSETEVVSV